MNEYMILAAGTLGSIAGGALGAGLSKAPIWKGAVATLIASILQFIIGELFSIKQPLVDAIIYLILLGLIGGRWGMGLTARQLSLVLIGSFLCALAAAAAVLYLAQLSGIV